MPKKVIILHFIFLLFSLNTVQAQKGISIGKNGDPPNKFSELEIVSDSKGILIPRLSTQQRISVNPDNSAKGLLVYDTDIESFWYFDGTLWKEIGEGDESYQQLSFNSTTNILTLENGGDIDLSSLDQSSMSVNDADADSTNELELPESPVEGDIAYFDGSDWQRLEIGSDGQVLQVSSGVPTWKTPSGGGNAHQVGDLYLGGIIFYVYTDPNDGLQHGLICSLDDVDNEGDYNIAWSKKFGITGANSYYDGRVNSDILESSSTENAALSIRTHPNLGPEWYLPSVWELNMLFNNSYMIHKILENDGNPATHGFTGTKYWSSTETDNLVFAYCFMNTTNRQILVEGEMKKENAVRVRAVRAF